MQAGATAFDTCCIATTDNSFPAAKSTIVGGVQAVSGESNWGFDEETQTVPYVSNKGRYTGMCFKVTRQSKWGSHDRPSPLDPTPAMPA